MSPSTHFWSGDPSPGFNPSPGFKNPSPSFKNPSPGFKNPSPGFNEFPTLSNAAPHGDCGESIKTYASPFASLNSQEDVTDSNKAGSHLERKHLVKQEQLRFPRTHSSNSLRARNDEFQIPSCKPIFRVASSLIVLVR
jgi:hypothetical protein